jgi:hypothetical protein
MTTLFERLADRLDPAIDPLLHDPAGWTKLRLGEELWSKEREIIESIHKHRRTAVPSCHESGKSYLASRAMAHWIDCHPPGEAFVVSTADTDSQVKAVLWRELRKAATIAKRRGKPFPGRMNLGEWYLTENGDELVAFGRKAADTDPSAFQGIHARYVLVVIDEACGVPKALWDAADSLIANEDSRMLAIGNPDDSTSYFAEVCKPGSGWNVIPIDAYQTPNFTGEWVPKEVRPLLISKLWVEEKAKVWGENSPLFLAKVRGQFPESADDGVVRLSSVRHCQLGEVEDDGVPVELGVDVGGGGDYSVIRERRGMKPGRVWRDHQPDTMTVVGLTVRAIAATGASSVKVDVIGIGWGVADRLEELRRDGAHKARVVRVNVGEASTEPKRFPKLRDQIWWEVGRQLTEDGAWDLSEEDDDVIAQLIAPKYSIDSAGRVKVEPKEETRARIGRSPDDADALLLAYYSPAAKRRGFAAVA